MKNKNRKKANISGLKEQCYEREKKHEEQKKRKEKRG